MGMDDGSHGSPRDRETWERFVARVRDAAPAQTGSLNIPGMPSDDEMALTQRRMLERNVSSAVLYVLNMAPTSREYLDQVIGRLIEVFDPSLLDGDD